MIYIPKPSSPPDISAYQRRNEKADDGSGMITGYEQERRRAISRFCGPDHPDHDPHTAQKFEDFSFYTRLSIRAELERLYHNKCAYCESQINTTADGNIEHFRPKNEIDTGTEKLTPGYYWLGGDWDNLLLSCTRCNQKRKYKNSNGKGTITRGKDTKFPVIDESKRARSHTDSIKEEDKVRLLFNPSADKKVETQFKYDQDGAIQPAKSRGIGRKRAESSIDVFVLDRGQLTKDRAEAMENLQRRLQFLRSEVRDFHRAFHEGLDEVELDSLAKTAKELLNEIRKLLSKEATYLGCKRQVYFAFLDTPDCEELRELGCDLRNIV